MIQDPLSQTQMALQLESLVQSKQLSPSIKKQVQDELATIPEHQYLARFPAQLLRRFRLLAYLIALSVCYFAILLIGFVNIFTAIVLESFSLQSLGGIASTLFGILAGLVLAVWTYEMVYCLAGQLGLFLIAGRSLNTLGEQPDRLTISADYLYILQPSHDQQSARELAWKDTEAMISADYRLWDQPIALFSRQILTNIGEPFIVEGITSNYAQLSHEIRAKLPQTAKYINSNFMLLANRWTYLTIAIAIGHAWYLIAIGQIKMTAQNTTTGTGFELFWSILFLFMTINTLIIFPAVVLWRVYLYRRFLARLQGYRASTRGDALLLVITILMSMIAIVWLVITPSLKIDGSTSDRSSSITTSHLTVPNPNHNQNIAFNKTNDIAEWTTHDHPDRLPCLRTRNQAHSTLPLELPQRNPACGNRSGQLQIGSGCYVCFGRLFHTF